MPVIGELCLALIRPSRLTGRCIPISQLASGRKITYTSTSPRYGTSVTIVFVQHGGPQAVNHPNMSANQSGCLLKHRTVRIYSCRFG